MTGQQARKPPAVDIGRLHAGPHTDWLVARHVLEWEEWSPGAASTRPLFVVNPVTRAIERCVADVWACGGPAYPECAGSYRFSQKMESAAEIYKLLPMQLQDWRLSPLDICKTALQWKLYGESHEDL